MRETKRVRGKIKELKKKKKYNPHTIEEAGNKIIKPNVSTVSSYFKETLLVHNLSFEFH